jgi:hypothetical protein
MLVYQLQDQNHLTVTVRYLQPWFHLYRLSVSSVPSTSTLYIIFLTTHYLAKHSHRLNRMSLLEAKVPIKPWLVQNCRDLARLKMQALEWLCLAPLAQMLMARYC